MQRMAGKCTVHLNPYSVLKVWKSVTLQQHMHCNSSAPTVFLHTPPQFLTPTLLLDDHLDPFTHLHKHTSKKHAYKTANSPYNPASKRKRSNKNICRQ